LEKKSNKLINELSPYLLQHAYNPVDWHPWSEATFDLAKEHNKPVFLSIGYSACHWCHVMEHESFDDPEIAKMMNDTFVNIKVDREERPDIDHIYMTVCQVMTGSGGWPLTVLLTPDKKPFFAGTYFPKESSGNRVGIKDIINRTRDIWDKHYNELLASADEILEQINFVRESGNLGEINDNLIKKCFYELAGTFDDVWGGFSKKPKFPIPHNLIFLLNFYHQFHNEEAKSMAIFTLQKMKMGGMYDHIGFGFHRYSTDQEWLVPHFEKMLYDQALLMMAYVDAYQLTQDEGFAITAKEILQYVNSELLSPEGAFYSAEDADSEGEEGKYYLWNIDEIRKNFIGDVELFCQTFNIKEKGNYFDEFRGQFNGNNIIHQKDDLKETSKNLGLDYDEFLSNLNRLKNKLFEIRKQRVKPNLDDKILTDWNGLMIAAYAKAARVFADEQYLELATNAYLFINTNLTKKDGKLLHRYRNGSSGIEAMIDDYSFLIWGLIEIFKSNNQMEFINKAIELLDICIDDFYDADRGAFYFASTHSSDLIIRKKEVYDGAVPSGNSVMLSNLLFISKFTNEEKYKSIIDKSISNFAISIAAVPSAYTFYVNTLIEYLKGSTEIVISGNDEKEIDKAFVEISKIYIPSLTVFRVDPQNKYPEWLENYKESNSKIKIYICRNYTCSVPFNNIEDAIVDLIK